MQKEPEGISEITIIKTVLAADETAANAAFTAAAPWSIIVPEAAEEWITVSPERGDAGTYIVNITFEKNLTGTDRAAEIAIACNGGEAFFGVTQSAKKIDETLSVTGVTLDKPKLTLTEGVSETLTATIALDDNPYPKRLLFQHPLLDTPTSFPA